MSCGSGNEAKRLAHENRRRLDKIEKQLSVKAPGALSEKLRLRLITFLDELWVGPDEIMEPVCSVCLSNPCDDDCERLLLLGELER